MGQSINWDNFFKDLARETAESVHDESNKDEPSFETQLQNWVKQAIPGENRPAAADLIRLNRAEENPELNLGDGLQEGFGLMTLPDCIGDLPHLEVLRLVGNQLLCLPASMGKLVRLRAVYLFGNRLSRLPDGICNCAALERLYLAGNRLENLPEGIGALQKLQVLSLPGNRLKALPETFGELSNLRDLYLFDNPITQLPASFIFLDKLERIHFGNSFLKEQYSRLKKSSAENQLH